MLSEKKFTDIYLGDHARFYSGIPGSKDPVPSDKDDQQELDELLVMCKDIHLKNGREEFNVKHLGVAYRASLLRTIEESVFVLRRFPSKVPQLDALDLQAEWVERMMAPGLTGLVCIAGPYGQGKTTTASALLSARLQKYGGVGVTIENPTEMPLEGKHGEGYCFQTEVEQGAFGQACRQAARWAPSIIFLGEVRDSETASEALKAAINGRLVICTTHAESVTGAIDRLYALANGVTGSSDDTSSLLAEGLSIVFHQTLANVCEKKVPKVGFLSLVEEADGKSCRSLIRERKFNQLQNAVQMQLNRLRINKIVS